MIELKNSDIREETIYFWYCPFCNFDNESLEDPLDAEDLKCEDCNSAIEIIK